MEGNDFKRLDQLIIQEAISSRWTQMLHSPQKVQAQHADIAMINSRERGCIPHLEGQSSEGPQNSVLHDSQGHHCWWLYPG